jgi:ribose transport system permease protein
LCVFVHSFLRTLSTVYYDGILGIAWPIIVFAVVAIIGESAMRRSRFRALLRPSAATTRWHIYSSVSVDRHAPVIPACAGRFATIMRAARFCVASTECFGWELETIAAVIIGGTILKGGWPHGAP